MRSTPVAQGEGSWAQHRRPPCDHAGAGAPTTGGARTGCRSSPSYGGRHCKTLCRIVWTALSGLAKRRVEWVRDLKRRKIDCAYCVPELYCSVMSTPPPSALPMDTASERLFVSPTPMMRPSWPPISLLL